jgi:hypothetical protein
MSFPVIHELCGEYSAAFYDLKRCLDAACSRDALREFESALAASELKEVESRKLRLLLGRRWKTVA